MLETRLKAGDQPTTAVATTTLELGIDLGSVQSVAQVGAPRSLSGLKQRLGRSGRRGSPAVLRIYVREDHLDPDSDPLDKLCEKYVHPPYSTDFAIMYLPTEGLFAEVIRRPGLASEIQTKHRIMIQGPTTLAALLSSLQMGFRTLAIEKRSSEVWQVLGAAKAEFLKYGQVWEKLGKQLDTARKTVDEAGKRTRAVNRKLRDVETLEGPETPALIELVLGEEDDQELSPI